MDGWSAAFLVAFIAGLLFTAIGFLLGGHHGAGHGHAGGGHAGGHAGPGGHVGHSGHAGHHGHGQGHHGNGQHADGGRAEPSHQTLSPFNPLILASFIGTTGGIAFLAHRAGRVHAAFALLFGVLAGLVVAGGLFRLVTKIFLSGGGGETRSGYELVDRAATVSVAIAPTATGRIDFVASGRRQTMAARSAEGVALAKGTPVVVLRLDRGIAYVAALADAAGGDPSPTRETQEGSDQQWA